MFELSFLAELEPMTLHSFEIRRTTYDDPLAAKTAKVSCRGCKTLDTQYEGTFSHFEVENITVFEYPRFFVVLQHKVSNSFAISVTHNYSR